MSTAALRAYVPRPSSLPPSPAKLAASHPGPSQPAYSPRSRELPDEAKKSATLILELLSGLPAPLPPTLGRTFNTTPSPPSSATVGPGPSSSSFSSFARKRPSDPSPIGLGLGLSPLGHSPKRARHSPPPTAAPALATSSSTGADRASPAHPNSNGALSPEARFHTPDLGRSHSSPTFANSRKEVGRSSLRNEIARAAPGASGSKEAWSRDQWKDHGLKIRTRAVALKRHGDAYQRTTSAKPHLVSTLPADNMMGLLCLTDSSLLFTYALWCDEQAYGRASSSVYRDLDGLVTWVRKMWESEMRRAEGNEKEMARGMVGLMHLVEAVLAFTQSTQSLHYLHRRSKELSASSSNHGPSPPSSASSTGPSPPSTSHSDSVLPSEIVPLISTSSTSSSRATSALLTSRHHLSIRLLRQAFPSTWEAAIHSELADQVLPAPGDALGAAKSIDLDKTDRFAWPIELGMQNPAAHVTVFGRAMVEEMAKKCGKKWDLYLGAEDK